MAASMCHAMKAPIFLMSADMMSCDVICISYLAISDSASARLSVQYQ